MKSDWKKSLWKGVKAILIFLLPILLLYLQVTDVADKKILDLILQFCPWLATITVGGIIAALLNYLKIHKVS